MLHNYYIANKRFFKPCGMIYAIWHRGVCLSPYKSAPLRKKKKQGG